jgi:hypothetical protein
MKNLISSVFILAILGSCNKEGREAQNTIPDPPEGTFEVIFYGQSNNVVFTRKEGIAFYGVSNIGTQIRLDDPDPVNASSTNPNDVVFIIFQLNYQLSSPGTVDTSGFHGFLWDGRFVPVWGYETQIAELKITEVMQGKMRGEFTMTVTAANSSNPNWGNRITIKGKFYAQCGGYGC